MGAPAEASFELRSRAQDLCERARRYLDDDDSRRAADCCRQALFHDANCYPAHLLLAQIELPGEHYLHLLERIHRHLAPRTYLEIGVNDGASIALAGKGTLCIGIDPEPRIDRRLRPSVRIVQTSSDEFFASHDLKSAYSGKPLDLAFIDGMHRFEFALRDFINVERRSAPGTIVLVHDCYPLDALTSARNRVTKFWSGDVWKLIVCLKKYRPDLAVDVLGAPPTRLGVIRRLDRKSVLLATRLESLYEEFVPLDCSALEPDKPSALALLPGTSGAARRLFD